MDNRRKLWELLEAKRLKMLDKPWYQSRTFWMQAALVLLPWLGPLMKMPESVQASVISLLAAGTIGVKVGDRKKVKDVVAKSIMPVALLLSLGCAHAS